ncbi:hypothetical protein ACZ90_46465 [Streptomyces albus subsp. albus]|nr:hypothetical protein ACZ90_46465 [Streptomyces albus subsp. albus]
MVRMAGMKWKNTLSVLALLPLNAVLVGAVVGDLAMGQWAASYKSETYEPQVSELAWTLVVAALIGGLLAWRRLYGAAAVQVVWLLVLTGLVTG